MSATILAQGFPDWSWFTDRNVDRLIDAFLQHVQFTVLAVLLGLLIATPLAVLAVRRRRLYNPLLTLTGVLFTIPSVALFTVLLAFLGFLGFGLNLRTSLTGLTIYTLLILFRNTVAGLDGVPRDILEAADAMGYRSTRRLVQVEAPIALPVFIAGIRIATVTTIGLVTITALFGQGGLGQFFVTGFQRQDTMEVAVGLVFCIALAIAADLALVGVQRKLTPWSRERGT
jgi:osmoprotectant transport system permease protein